MMDAMILCLLCTQTVMVVAASIPHIYRAWPALLPYLLPPYEFIECRFCAAFSSTPFGNHGVAFAIPNSSLHPYGIIVFSNYYDTRVL